MCSVLHFSTRNCSDDSCTNYLPIILDPRVLWISHGRAFSSCSSSFNVWMCGPISTISTWQYSQHTRSPILPCWSEVQLWNSLSTIWHTEGSHMCSVHKVTLNFIHVLYTIILSSVLLFGQCYYWAVHRKSRDTHWFLSHLVWLLPYTRVNKRIRLFPKLQGNMRLIPNMRLINGKAKIDHTPKTATPLW